MFGVFHNISIRGVSAVVPSIVERTEAASGILGQKRCKRQIRVTGIKERHVSPQGQKMSDLCYVAADRLLKHLSWNPKEIKVLVLLTQTGDFKVPSTAFLIQKMLGLSSDCVVFDVNLGCSAFNVGLQIVSSLLNTMPDGTKGICMQGDYAFQTSGQLSADALANVILFGSAGSAVALEKVPGSLPIPYGTFSDGSRYDAILSCKGGTVKMKGEEVFNFSMNDVANSLNEFMAIHQLSDSNVDFYVFHQAQKMILDNIDLSCGISAEKDLRSLETYGNTSGASIPLSLCANREKFEDRDAVRVFSCGFGVGLSWSMAYTRLDTAHILPVIVSDTIY